MSEAVAIRRITALTAVVSQVFGYLVARRQTGVTLTTSREQNRLGIVTVEQQTAVELRKIGPKMSDYALK